MKIWTTSDDWENLLNELKEYVYSVVGFLNALLILCEEHYRGIFQYIPPFLHLLLSSSNLMAID